MNRSLLFLSRLTFLCVSVLYGSIFYSAYAAQPASAGLITGKVTDTINSSGIVYVEVDTGSQKVWAARAGATQLNKGDIVSFSTEMPMHNYHSKKLNRDFELIYFIKKYITGNDVPQQAPPANHASNPGAINSATFKYLSNTQELQVGDFLREVTMDGLQGDKKSFSEFKGKPLLINVWASWCGPCRAEMASLEELSNRFNRKQFNIIGISTDDYRDKALAAIRESKITFDNFLDNKLVLEKMLGANTIPLTILIDKNGKVLQKVRGARKWDSPVMVSAIASAFQINLNP